MRVCRCPATTTSCLLLTSVEAGETVALFIVLLKRLYLVQEFIVSQLQKELESVRIYTRSRLVLTQPVTSAMADVHGIC